MIKKKYCLLLFLFILLPINTNAECSNQEIVRLKNIASNVNFTTDYVEINNEVTFNIKINNLHKDIYIFDNFQYKNIHGNTNEVTISNYLPGFSVKYDFYSNIGSCKGEYLYSRYVNLPPYNSWYNDPLCSGIEEFKLCQKWIVNNFSYRDFINQISDYKYREIIDKEEPDKIDENKTILDIVIAIFIKYYIYILGSIIVIGSILIYYLYNKNNFKL